MEILIKVLQLFLCFTILVGIHEAGHFFMARLFKIRVEKFYIFFDPWFSLFKFKRKDTEYGIGWLPLGGYVKIAGMIDESMDKEQMAQPMKPDEFRAKPAWQRLLVMIAGVVMNMILAIVIYCGISYVWGDSYFANSEAKWGYTFNDAGKELGFVDGDKFVAIEGEKIDNYQTILNDLLITEGDRRVTIERDGQVMDINIPLADLILMRQNKGYEGFLTPREPYIVDSVIQQSTALAGLLKGDEIIAINQTVDASYIKYVETIKAAAGSMLAVQVLRGDQVLNLLVPASSEGAIGVIALNPFKLHTQHYTLLESIPAGFKRAQNTIVSYWEQLKLIVQPKTKMYEELGGFIAIGSLFPGTWNWLDFWNKTAFLSIILAIMNILPIPGLDGGHTMFTLWEVITGRKVNDKVLEIAQYVGLIILFSLLFYANGNDIYRFFIK